VKKSLTRFSAFAALGALAALTASPARGQEVSDEKVRSLLAEARAQAQAPSGPQQQPAVDGRAVVNLTMDEAVAKALDQNLDLSVARLTPQIQDFTVQQSRAFYTPTLTGQFGQRSQTSNPANIFGGGGAGGAQLVNSDNITFNVGLAKPLPWTGGTATLNWANSRSDSTNTGNTINPRYNSDLVAQLVQPLLRNRGIDANRQSMLTAEINRRLADVSLRATTINTVANTRNAYWDLVYATQALETAGRSLALAEKLVQDNQARVEIGTMAPIDVVQAQSEAAARRLGVVQAEAALRTAELVLKRLLVAGTGDPLWTAALNPTDRPPAMAAEKIDVEAALKRALTERTDLVQSMENLKISDVSMKYLKNQTQVGLDLTASYAAGATAGTVGRWVPQTGGGYEWVTNVPGGYGDALRMLQEVRLPTWILAVNVSYPIGGSAQEASYARSKVQYQQSLAQLRALELRIATDITNAAMNVNSNLQQVQAAAASRELAQKRLEAEQSKFEVGMSTNYNVVLAQRDFADAQDAELRALLNYRKSLVEFDRLQQTSSSGSGVTSVSASGSSGAPGGASGGTSSTGGSSGGSGGSGF